MASESVVDSQDMVLMARKFADSIMVVIRVQKLSMPGTGGGACRFPFYYSGRATMPKELLTYQQQMEKLRSSGLAIEDEEACCRVLADIGYFPVVNGYHRFPRPEHPGIPRRRHFWG